MKRIGEQLRRLNFLLIAFLFLGLIGCATMGTPNQTFDKLTPDEQSRVILSAFQNGTDVLYDVGRTAMIVKPEYKPIWVGAVKPSFSELNKILLDLETKGSQGQQITVPVILQSVQGRIAQIISVITQYGALEKMGGSKIAPDNYAVIATIGFSTGIVMWNDVVALMSGNIPTWEMIMARNAILQAKIDIVE